MRPGALLAFSFLLLSGTSLYADSTECVAVEPYDRASVAQFFSAQITPEEFLQRIEKKRYLYLLPPFDDQVDESDRMIERPDCSGIWVSLFDELYHQQFERRVPVMVLPGPTGFMLIRPTSESVLQNFLGIFTNSLDPALDLRNEGQESGLARGLNAIEVARALGMPLWFSNQLKAVAPTLYFQGRELSDEAFWRDALLYSVLRPTLNSADQIAASFGNKIPAYTPNLKPGEIALQTALAPFRMVDIAFDVGLAKLGLKHSDRLDRKKSRRDLEQKLAATYAAGNGEAVEDFGRISQDNLVQTVRRETDRYESIQLALNSDIHVAWQIGEILLFASGVGLVAKGLEGMGMAGASFLARNQLVVATAIYSGTTALAKKGFERLTYVLPQGAGRAKRASLQGTHGLLIEADLTTQTLTIGGFRPIPFDRLPELSEYLSN